MKKQSKADRLAAIAFVEAMSMTGHGRPVMPHLSRRPQEIPEEKQREGGRIECGLPSCKAFTLHKGGFCCVEHALQNKRLRAKKS